MKSGLVKRLGGKWDEWKWLTKIILALVWGFFLFGVIYTLIVNGTFISTLICTPFLFMVTLAAALFFYLARDDEESKRKNKAPLSGMLVYSTILFVFFWVMYIIMMLVFYPEADAQHQSDFLVTCTPFVLIMTVMFVLFIVYELKKPWKNRLYADSEASFRRVNDGSADLTDVNEFFEPASVADSEQTKLLRKMIMGLIGLTVALTLLSLPWYSQETGTASGGSTEFLLLCFKIIFPIIMVIIIILFIAYARLKYKDWHLYIQQQESQGKNIPEQLRDDEDDGDISF